MKIHFESGENDNSEMFRIECKTPEEFELVKETLLSFLKRKESDILIGNFKEPIFKNARNPFEKREEDNANNV